MSDEFNILEPAIDPNNRISFLLDWELTMKCNLDCSYCPTGIYGGHDNTTRHPELDECLKTIDFMYRYVDLYMRHKPKGLRYVILNVYGGESLHHPHVVEILKKCREVYDLNYRDRWHLTITTTTNAIISRKKFDSIIPLIDEFTCSYHTENTPKQKDLFRENVKAIQNSGRRVKVIVLMHAESGLFGDAQNIIKWCEDTQIKYLPRALDNPASEDRFYYTQSQIKWFDNLYQKKSYRADIKLDIKPTAGKFDLSQNGRACCGGRQLCKDSDKKSRHFFVKNNFFGWHCSVNEFFLYIKQVNGEIYVNKDCKMSFDGTVAPIGNLSDTEKLLTWTEESLSSSRRPHLVCAKSYCLCGLCAPKAADENDFENIMKIYRL